MVKPDTGEFVPLFVTNTSRLALSVEAGQEVGQASLWEDRVQQGEVDARVDDLSKEMLICGDGILFSSVVASEYEFEVADSESGAEAARKPKLAEDAQPKIAFATTNGLYKFLMSCLLASAMHQ